MYVRGTPAVAAVVEVDIEIGIRIFMLYIHAGIARGSVDVVCNRGKVGGFCRVAVARIEQYACSTCRNSV